MKTDRELDREIYERQARLAEITKDGWKRLINQGRAAYEKGGKYLDANGKPCKGPEEIESEQPVRRGRGRPTTIKREVIKMEPTENITKE